MDKEKLRSLLDHRHTFHVPPAQWLVIMRELFKEDKYHSIKPGCVIDNLNKAGNDAYSERRAPVLSTDYLLSTEELDTIHKTFSEIDNLFRFHNSNMCRFHYMRDYISALDQKKVKQWNVKSPIHTNVESRRGCCGSCAENNGYFRDELGNRWSKEYNDQLKEMKDAYGWNKYGFWSKDVMGCVLPRARRSRVCSTYCCDYVRKDIAEKLMTEVCDIRKKHKIIS
jgi:hypothetical protein